MNAVSSLVEAAVVRMGSQAKLAAAAGVTQPTVHKAIASGRVGVRLAAGIDAATNGEISKSALRPDVWPPVEATHGVCERAAGAAP